VRKATTTRPAAPSGSAKVVRCAVYTRKSTEEGLEQQFNSLDAQREAGETFVKSQTGEGWALIPERYVDDGYTQGLRTMSRNESLENL
jgi:site-specific DNA recombinase